MSKTTDELQQQHDPSDAVRHLRAELAEANRLNAKQRRESGRLETFFHDLREAVEALPVPKVDYYKPNKTSSTTPIVAVSHWTDWHMGCVVKQKETAGSNAFNPQILENRMKNCVRSELEWVGLQRKTYNIGTNHILCTGDLINGELHYDDTVGNALTVPEQINAAGSLLADLVASKVPHFEKVVVDFLVVDNHGRRTKKPQSKGAGDNHYGLCVGFIAQTMLRDQPKVQFNIHTAIHQKVKVGPRRSYLLTHGDRVSGWAGFPYYGLDRLAQREAVNAMIDMQEEAAKDPEAVTYDTLLALSYHRVILGHWHVPLKHPLYWIGGSAQGTTAYDFGQGRRSPPVQCSWLVHPEHGEFDMIDWKLKDDPLR